MVVGFGLVNFPDALLLLRLNEIGFGVVAVILAYVTYNLVYALGSYPAGLLADRLPRSAVFGIGLVFFAIGYIGLGLTTDRVTAWLLLGAYGLFAACTDGVGKAWISSMVGSDRQATAQGLFQGASWMRYVRSAVLDVVRLDYVTTARSKGLAERVVIVKHVVRNALIPVVTLVALQMPAVFGGAIVTEQIFRIPGIGSLLIDAILRNDTPVIMAVTFVFSCLVIIFNLIADLLYGWLDPRISFR